MTEAGRTDDETAATDLDLDDRTVEELRKLASVREIEGRSSMKLIGALSHR